MLSEAAKRYCCSSVALPSIGFVDTTARVSASANLTAMRAGWLPKNEDRVLAMAPACTPCFR
eukprot:3320447-Prymnesium_polylepis.1